MPEREVLGQGVVELVLEKSKLKPQLNQARSAISRGLGDAAKMSGRRGMFGGMASAAARAAMAAGRSIRQRISVASAAASKDMSKSFKSAGAGGGMGPAAGSAGRLSGTLDKLRGRFRNVDRSSRQSGRALGLFRRRLDEARTSGVGFGGMMAAVAGGNIFANMVGRITMRLKGMLAQGWQTSKMMETMSISFTKMVGSEGQAKKLLKTLREFSAQTPLQFPQIMSAATSLLATQKIAQDELLPTIKKLTDAAAGSTEGFSAFPRVVRAISQMFGKGRIQAEEMMQLAEAGIPAWDALANAMGMSIAEVRKLGETGKLGLDSITKLIDGLGDKFGGLAAQQAKTYAGLMSTLRDNIGKTSAEITKPFFKLAKVQLDNLVNWMATDDAKAFFKRITDGVQSVANIVEKAMNSPLIRSIALIGGGAVAFTAMAVAAKAALAGIMAFMSPVVVAVGAISAGAIMVGLSFKKALDSKHGKALRKNLSEIKDLAIEIGGNVLSGINRGLKMAADLMGKVFGFDTGKFWVSTTGGIRDFLDTVSLMTSDWEAGWSLMFNSAKLQLLKIHDRVKTFGERFKEAFAAAIGGVIGGFKAFVSQIKAFFIEIGNIASATGSGIAAVFKKIFDDPKALLSPETMAATFAEQFSKALAKQDQPEFLDYTTAMKDEAAKFSKVVRDMNKAAQAERAEGIAETEGKIKSAIDALSKARDKNREGKGGKLDTKKTETEEEMAKSAKKLADAAKSNVKTGRTSLLGLHDTIQDALGKKGDSPELKESKKHTKLLDDIKSGKGKKDSTIDKAVDAVSDAAGGKRTDFDTSPADKIASSVSKAVDAVTAAADKIELPGKPGDEAKAEAIGRGGAKEEKAERRNLIEDLKTALAADKTSSAPDVKLKNAMDKVLGDAGLDARQRRKTKEFTDITNDPEKYKRAVESRERMAARNRAKVDAAEETRKRILERKRARGTATARDVRRPFTGRTDIRPATEEGRRIQAEKAQSLLDNKMQRMVEGFTNLATAQNMAGEGSSAADVQKEILGEMKKGNAADGKLAAAFTATGDKILNNMGYGD